MITPVPGETVWEAVQRTMRPEVDEANRALNEFLNEVLRMDLKVNILVIFAFFTGGLFLVAIGVVIVGGTGASVWKRLSRQAWALAGLAASGDTPVWVGLALGIPIFLFVLVAPLVLFSGLREVFVSSLWTLTYRDLRGMKRFEAEPLPAVDPSRLEAAPAGSLGIDPCDR
ncbi:MAG: hypothetical protein R6X31_11010 [Anaerolineae bacterium]